MKILSRYIFRECLVYFGLNLLGFTSILLTIRMIKFANLIVNKGVEFSQIAQVFIAIVPTFLEIAIPMATLLGVMMAFARFSGDSEIIVIRASGISLFQLLPPIILFGILVSGFSFYVSHSLKPWGFQKLSQAFFDIARTKSTSGLSEGVFNPLGKITLYSEKVDYVEGNLVHVLIDDRRDEATRKIVISRAGIISSDPEAQTISILLKDGEIHEQVDQRYTLTHFITNNLTFRSDELIETGAKKKDQPIDEMGNALIRKNLELLIAQRDLSSQEELQGPPLPIEMQEHAILKAKALTIQTEQREKRIRKLSTELGRRYSMPFAALLLALIAMPLGVIPPRTQKTYGVGLSILLGIFVFVIYYGLLSVGLTVGESDASFVLIGLWLPNVVTFLLAMLYIWKVGTEQWHSVAEAIGNSIGRGSRLFRREKQQ